MDISIGADVIGTDGKLGEISDVIAETQSDQIVAVIVKHGFAFSRSHTVVPLTFVERIEAGQMHVNLNRAALDHGSEYLQTLHADYTNYMGPPGFDGEGGESNFQMDTLVASFGRTGAKIGGFPGGEAVTPEDIGSAEISLGMPIIAADGQKVGEVGELCFAVETGSPSRLTVKTGHLIKHHTELPVAWIRDLSIRGVLLNAATSQVEALIKSRSGEVP
jgi:uncharacterized protein YrrD